MWDSRLRAATRGDADRRAHLYDVPVRPPPAGGVMNFGRVFSLCALLALAISSGCSGCTDPKEDACGANGSACTGNGDCCSSFCDAGTCGTPCKANAASCAAGSECCSGFCYTSLPPDACATQCKPNASTCAAGTECCSGFCDGTNHCATPCKTNGTTCAAGGECCTGFCDTALNPDR